MHGDLQTWTWIRMMKVCLLIVAVVAASASAQRGPGGRPKPRCDDGSKPVCADGSRPVKDSASKSSIRRFVITEKAPTRAFSWLKAATTAFTFKTLC